jgi:hypothetical protein
MFFKIEKVIGETQTGREYVMWNVTDSRDGYVYDAFELKRDAKYWIEQVISKQVNK